MNNSNRTKLLYDIITQNVNKFLNKILFKNIDKKILDQQILPDNTCDIERIVYVPGFGNMTIKYYYIHGSNNKARLYYIYTNIFKLSLSDFNAYDIIDDNVQTIGYSYNIDRLYIVDTNTNCIKTINFFNDDYSVDVGINGLKYSQLPVDILGGPSSNEDAKSFDGNILYPKWYSLIEKKDKLKEKMFYFPKSLDELEEICLLNGVQFKISLKSFIETFFNIQKEK